MALTAGTPLSGGANPTIMAADHQSFLDAAESYAFNAIGCPSDDETLKSLYTAFTKRMRDEQGVKFQCVLYNYPADYEGAVNLLNTVIDDGAEVYSLIPWATGVIAGTEVNQSALNRVKVAAGTNHNAPTDKTCSVNVNLYSVYGVSINLTNSNPETSVTYTDDAAGMTGGGAAWDTMPIFKDIKPCLLKNGVVQYYLNPNDFAQKADGSAADITSGNDGDVMIEFPKTGFKINTSGNTLTVQVTDNPNAGAQGFRYYAHTRAVEGDRDKLYIGAYLGYVLSGKLRSLSGKSPTVSQTIGTFRTQAQANGSGYDLFSFHPLTLIQCLYLIRFKNLNSQAALGQGYTGGSASLYTGGTNTNGMNYGSSASNW